MKSFFIAFRGMNGEINPENVNTIQKIELYFVADYLGAMFSITAYEEIQLENPISKPTYKNNNKLIRHTIGVPTNLRYGFTSCEINEVSCPAFFISSKNPSFDTLSRTYSCFSGVLRK